MYTTGNRNETNKDYNNTKFRCVQNLLFYEWVKYVKQSSILFVQMELLNSKSCPRSHRLINVTRSPNSVTRCVRLPTRAQLNDPSGINLHMNNIKDRLWYVIPNPVKEFPWKKAESIALKQFLITAKEALKWSLVAVLIFGSISDVLFSISMNKELLIPFGLFVGCVIANFLKEISRELFPNPEVSFAFPLLLVSVFSFTCA